MTEKNGPGLGYLISLVVPAQKILVFDWYDGPIQGVFESVQGYCFRFDLIRREENENEGEPDFFYYQLTPIQMNDFHCLALELERVQEAKWPIWVPLWSFSDNEQSRQINELATKMTDNSAPPLWTIKTRGGPETILSIEPLMPNAHLA